MYVYFDIELEYKSLVGEVSERTIARPRESRKEERRENVKVIKNGCNNAIYTRYNIRETHQTRFV
jgi:hypothetical protein